MIDLEALRRSAADSPDPVVVTRRFLKQVLAELSEARGQLGAPGAPAQ